MNKFLELLDQIYETKKSGLSIFVANAVPFCVSKNKKKMSSVLFGARFDEGHSRIIYDSKGYFKPSYFIDVNLGNTIKEAINNLFLKEIKSLNFLHKKYRKCKYLRDCLGESRYLAYEFKGSYFATDP